MKVLFLDESGDHNLDKIDSQYPVFVLGGIITDISYAKGKMKEEVKNFKLDFFDSDDVILHTADITRNRKELEILKDEDIRNCFYQKLNNLMRRLDYKVVACAIKKHKHKEKYGQNRARDPYLYSLDVLIERFCYELGNHEKGIIVAEKRRKDLDELLENNWERVKIVGTSYLKARIIKNRIDALLLRDKKENIAGLQIADLIVSPIGRAVIGKKKHKDWGIIKSKFCRKNGEFKGIGLVVLPN